MTDGQRGGAPWRPLTPDGGDGHNRWRAPIELDVAT
jgi:hypothetical protein